jgi:prevent-host-death family protein
MKMSVEKIQSRLEDVVDQIARGGDRVVLTRNGKRVAALVSVEELAALERFEDEADIRAARKARKEKGGVTIDEFRQRLEDESDPRAALRAKAEMNRKEEKGIPLAEVKRRLGMK